MMPQSSQNLYFHLGMNADDDGFCEHFTIMRMTESKPDDLKVLNGKGFVRVFDEKVLVITDWKENNYLRSDRYTPSKYLEIYKEEIKALAGSTDIGIPMVDQMATQVRVGKVRKGKVSHKSSDVNVADLNPLILLFKEVNPNYENLYRNKTERDALQRMVDKFGTEKVENAIKKLPEVINKKYAPKITTPFQLEKDLGKLIAFVRQEDGGVKITKV